MLTQFVQGEPRKITFFEKFWCNKKKEDRPGGDIIENRREKSCVNRMI